MPSVYCCTRAPCNRPLTGMLILIMAGGLFLVAVGLLRQLSRVSLPQATTFALITGAVGATVAGLWLGYLQRGRAEPLAVGLFGMSVAGIGHLIRYPITLLGAVIVVAAGWSSLARPREPGS